MRNLSEEARKLRNAYQKEWKRKNPDKVRKYNTDFWERKAAGYTIIQKARDLRQKGMTQREIAKELKISVGAVNAHLLTN
jgi:hypothetical protein